MGISASFTSSAFPQEGNISLNAAWVLASALTTPRSTLQHEHACLQPHNRASTRDRDTPPLSPLLANLIGRLRSLHPHIAIFVFSRIPIGFIYPPPVVFPPWKHRDSESSETSQPYCPRTPGVLARSLTNVLRTLGPPLIDVNIHGTLISLRCVCPGTIPHAKDGLCPLLSFRRPMK